MIIVCPTRSLRDPLVGGRGASVNSPGELSSSCWMTSNMTGPSPYKIPGTTKLTEPGLSCRRGISDLKGGTSSYLTVYRGVLSRSPML